MNCDAAAAAAAAAVVAGSAGADIGHDLKPVSPEALYACLRIRFLLL